MLTKITRLLLLMILVLNFSSCKNEDNPTEPNQQSNTTNPTGQPIPNFANQQDVNGVMAAVRYSQISLVGFPAVETDIAFAMFGNGIDAGSVSVNGTSLGKINQGGKILYMVPDPSNPMQFLSLSWNGSNHSWNVSGGNGIPSLTGSVKSPNDFSIIQPSANSAVSKANGIQIKWSNTSSTSKILVQITGVNSSQSKFYEELSDNGSYTIPTSDLSSFNGDCMLFVVRYTYNYTTSGGKKYYFVSEIVKSVNIKVN